MNDLILHGGQVPDVDGGVMPGSIRALGKGDHMARISSTGSPVAGSSERSDSFR